MKLECKYNCDGTACCCGVGGGGGGLFVCDIADGLGECEKVGMMLCLSLVLEKAADACES